MLAISFSYFVRDLFRNVFKKCFRTDASRIDFKIEGINMRLGLKGKGLAEGAIVLLPRVSFLLLTVSSIPPFFLADLRSDTRPA